MNRLEKIADLESRNEDKWKRRIDQLKKMSDREYEDEQIQARAAASRLAAEFFSKK